MKLKNPTMTDQEARSLAGITYGRLKVRIGNYYSKLNTHQKQRFNRIVGQIARWYQINRNQYPLEMLLIRQIALNTVRIEHAESHLLEQKTETWSRDVEKWLFLAQKERRDAIALLTTLVKVTEKKDSVTKFDDFRNVLRNGEDLPESKTEYAKDGHQRRYYDKVTRTK